jgi:RHS repeat-associated protein
VTFIWDGDDLLNERIEGANAARYAVLDGEVLSEKRGASRYRFVPDPLGSVRAVLDTSGSIVATRDYWPYGEVAAQSGSMTAIQFVGALGYFTDTTNRVYIRARHYRPDLGRWVTRDPIGFAGGDWDPCSYARCHPGAVADPSGRQATGGVCEYARQRGWDVYGGRRNWGGVVCYYGMKVPCCWEQNLPGYVTNAHARTCVCECLIEHERGHFSDSTCPTRGVCLAVFHWPPGRADDMAERRAYDASVACLLRAVGDCCSRAPGGIVGYLACAVGVMPATCDACENARDRCGQAGLPFGNEASCRNLCSSPRGQR